MKVRVRAAGAATGRIQTAGPNEAAKGGSLCRFPKSLWNFWKDGCTQSFWKSFNSCREQTRLKFVEGWTRRSGSLALEFGSCIHWCFSQLYKGPLPCEKDILQTLKKYDEVWRAENRITTKKSDEIMDKVYGLAEAVLPTYIQRWAGDWTGKYPLGNPSVRPAKWAHLEGRFKVPYTFEDGLVSYVQGAIDGVFDDSKEQLWQFESKTKSVIDEDEIMDTLPLDTQCLLYLWALKQLTGRMPRGVLYNVVRRPGLRLSAKESINDFFGRCKDDVQNPKRLDHYFIRYEMKIEPSELDHWEKTYLGPMMRTVRAWWEGTGEHWMEPAALSTKYGRADMYEAIVHNNFTPYRKRKVAFNELSEFMQ